jgi:hypothetical protein
VASGHGLFCDMLAPSGSSDQFGFYISDAPRDALGTYSFQRKIDSNSIGASATHFLPVAPIETASARRLIRSCDQKMSNAKKPLAESAESK